MHSREERSHTYSKVYDTEDNDIEVEELITHCQISEANDHAIFEPIHKLNAIWDTGSQTTAISFAAVDRLGLKPSGTITIKTPQEQFDAPTVLISLALPTGVVFQYFAVAVLEDLGDEAEVLIGMDVISHCNFAFTHARNYSILSLCAPPSEVIDFSDR